MQFLRSIAASVFLALLGLGLVASTPSKADAFHYRWYGWRNYPYYWNSGFYNPYRVYSPYTRWYGNYGGFFGRNQYYNWSRTYPWGWYW